MDPLSLTASIIAVIQAAQVVYANIQKFRNAPKEFSEVKTELFDLVKVLKQVSHLVKVIDSSSSHDDPDKNKDGEHHELLRAGELDELKMTVADLMRVVNDIGKAVQSSSDSKGKLARLPWFKKDGALTKGLLRESRRLQSTLVFYLSTLTPMQIKRHNHEMMEALEKLRHQIAAPKTKSAYSERKWETYSERPLRRWTNDSYLSESLPAYSPKRLNRPSTDSGAVVRTSKVPDHQAVNKPHNWPADAIPDQSSGLFPKTPSDDPSANERRPERTAEASTIAISEHQPRRRTPANEDLSQDTEPPIHERCDTLQICNDVKGLLGILEAPFREQEDENTPGSVAGLLDFDGLPKSAAQEEDSASSEQSNLEPQDTQNSVTAVALELDAKPRTHSPPMYNFYDSYGCYPRLREDHLAMYPCTCLRSTAIYPPRWFGYLFGALSLVFCLPFLSGNWGCCNAMCQCKPKQHIRLQLQLPPWLATNTCLSVFWWDSKYGLGGFLEWRRVREIDDPEAAFAIEKGDVRWLQQRVAARKLLPFDILKGVGEPLAYSLANIESGYGFEVANFLFRSGFHSLSGAHQICDASYIARLKMKVGIEYEQRHVWSLLRDIADLNRNSNLDQPTLLHDTAMQYTEFSLREVLAKNAPDINEVDGLGFTALHWSVMLVDLPSVKVLLKAGADVNVPTAVQKWSALHLACMRSSLETSTAIVEAGAHLEHEDHDGKTPLHYVPLQRFALVDLLLTHGADARHEDYHGNSVLHSMAWRKPPYLPDALCPDQEEARRGRETICALVSRGVGLNAENPRGETPLMLLAMRNPGWFGEPGSLDCISIADLRFPRAGWNVLHYAAYYWDAHALLQLSFYEAALSGGPPGFDPDAPDAHGRTPLEAFEHRMFATDEARAAGVLRPTREEARRFVELLLDCRESNWHEGCYLETKQRFLADGSQDKMEAWVKRQLDATPAYGSGLWQDTDVWWRDVGESSSSPEDACPTQQTTSGLRHRKTAKVD